jgi:hypothetical protein
MLFKSLIQAGKTYAPLFRYTINAGLKSSKITINIISEAYNHNLSTSCEWNELYNREDF